MRNNHEVPDLGRSWTFVERRDRQEDGELWAEIESLGLPYKLLDAHVHCGRKDDIGDVPLERLQRIKALNNRRWFHLSRMVQLHRNIFPDRDINFVPFPFPFLETNADRSNNYLIDGVAEGNRVLILGDPNDVDYTIQKIADNVGLVAGVKSYYDQIQINPDSDPEDVSIFDFFLLESIN